MSYMIKTFQTPEGPLTLDFDFVPKEPTTIQLGRFVPHTCNTCEWNSFRNTGHCKSPDLPEGEHCPNWEIDPIAHSTAIVEYYKDLHRRCYG